MRVTLQRVSEAQVTVEGNVVGEIQKGYVLLVGVEEKDSEEDVEWLTKKILNLRLFNDADGKMNLSVTEVRGSILSISQFTLHANIKKGNRPSFIRAAKPDHAIQLYELFNARLSSAIGHQIATGQFGAHMDVSLVNDGPVTILMDSKQRE